jgi:hypothetical protein
MAFALSGIVVGRGPRSNNRETPLSMAAIEDYSRGAQLEAVAAALRRVIANDRYPR